jgi:hypothetical protein
MKEMPLKFTIPSIVLASLALLFNFVSATRYDYVFAIILVCDTCSALCLIPLIKLGLRWNYVVITVATVIVYTVLDIGFRHFFGVRVFDIFRM